MDRLKDLSLLIGRAAIGVTFLAHGYQKATDIDGTVAGFEGMGIPLPTLAAWFTILVEVVGGAAFVVGLALPLVGVLFAAVMVGAIVYVHADGGFYARDGGYEYVLVLAAASVALGWNGGRLTLDRLLTSRRTSREPAPVGAG